MKKWIKRIVIAFLGTFVFLFGGLFFLLGTQSGTNLIVAQAEKLMDGQLQIASATGTFLDRLVLTNLLFQNPAAGKTALGKFVLDWKSSDLFSLHLHILELGVSELTYTASRQTKAESESAEPLTLPDLALPITINIEKLTADTITFYPKADAEPVTVSHATLSALWQTEGIELRELTITMPQAALQAKGTILPSGSYPLSLTTDIKTLGSDYPAVSLHGEYNGDLQKLTIQSALRGDMEADLNGTVFDLINGLAWDIKLGITDFAPKIFSPDIPGTINGTISSKGNLKKLNTTAQLSMHDQGGSYGNWDVALDTDVNLESLLIHVKQCTLKHVDSPAVITLAGTVDTKQQLDIALNWQDLQWPVTGNAEYNLPAGNLALTGTVDEYHLAMTTTLNGTTIPDTAIQLNSNGNTESARDIQLSIDTLGGTVALNGAVEWSPVVKWQADITAKTINPGVQYHAWPGTLNGLIQSDGHIAESGIFANITIANLQGVLRELPIDASADIAIVPEKIQINTLQLSSGKAKITARGLLGKQSNLQWNIQVDDFADLLPESSGQLTASGTVLGEMTQPEVTANVNAKAINTSIAAVDTLQLKTDLDLSWHKPFSIGLAATNLQSGDNQIQKIAMNANGEITKHSLTLSANHKLANLSLALDGGYDKEQWQGALSKLVLHSKDLGTWQTQTPAQIVAGAKSATIDKFCLTREQSDLCLSGTWDAENSNTGGTASLSTFPLNWLSPWFPDTLEDLGGTLSFETQANMQEKMAATAHIGITPGKIKYKTVKDTGTFTHEGMKIDINVADDGIDADLWLSVESNIISGKLLSPDLLRKNSDHSPTLNGKIKIDAKNFAIAEKLVEDIDNLNAQIDTDLSIKGTLAEPDVNGVGKLHINSILIPVAGLELADTSLNILADNSELKISGVFNSGKGAMALDGTALLNAEKNYPARITLKGENFRIVNLPEIQVYLSTDLTIEKKKDMTLLSGTIDIPKADILLRNLPKGAVTASPDIVIVQEQEETESKSPMQMDLKVSLGEKVYFAGFGISAFIDGQLKVSAEPDELMMGSGEFHIRQGSYRAYGQDLEIENGVISFPGGPLSQPGINLRATRSVGDVIAGISVIGSAKKPRITTFSKPPMSESQTLSYIITGASPSTGGAKLSVGRQINNKLSVSVGTDTKTGDSHFVARYRLSRKINVETSTGSNSNAADIFYTTEFGGNNSRTEEIKDKIN